MKPPEKRRLRALRRVRAAKGRPSLRYFRHRSSVRKLPSTRCRPVHSHPPEETFRRSPRRPVEHWQKERRAPPPQPWRAEEVAAERPSTGVAEGVERKAWSSEGRSSSKDHPKAHPRRSVSLPPQRPTLLYPATTWKPSCSRRSPNRPVQQRSQEAQQTPWLGLARTSTAIWRTRPSLLRAPPMKRRRKAKVRTLVFPAYSLNSLSRNTPATPAQLAFSPSGVRFSMRRLCSECR